MIRYLAAAAFALLPVAAGAQPTNPNPGRLDIVGLAPSACVIRAPTAASGVNATFEATGASSAQIRITEFVDPSNAQPRAASMDLAIPVICNGPHRVVVRSGNGGLRRLGAATQAGPFGEFLAYRVNTIWGDSQISSDSGGPILIDSASARAGQLSISVSVPPGGRPLVGGTYSDSIVLELQAAN